MLEESNRLTQILARADSYTTFKQELQAWAEEVLQSSPGAMAYYLGRTSGTQALEALEWHCLAAIRILDYIHHSGKEYEDLNEGGRKILNAPFRMLWQAFRQENAAVDEAFFEDMLYLFRQLSGRMKRNMPTREKVMQWMESHPDGLQQAVAEARGKNRDRILECLLEEMEAGRIHSTRFHFTPEMSQEEKRRLMREWWKDYRFHLRFAVRSVELLNKLLDYSLSEETLHTLQKGREAGIPTFVNPYYLSLLDIGDSGLLPGADQAIRDYIFISPELVKEFGRIVAWEMEDVVEPGKPNAAGWILPTRHNLHRRYPEVAILIPETLGRACGGLCVSCQRMYDFQSGNLNFNLEQLQPDERWPEKLRRLMAYFENDTQLRDILITGGDALMSTDKSLHRILNAVYDMALRKREANKARPEGEKYAEILRVRLGTRLPAYLPQRITPSLIEVLTEFRLKASQIGIRQFVIQTHFETAMEITPEVREAVALLTQAGWMVTNQQVFTAAASKRGHTARLRQVLNEIGVLTYYTFSVKGYRENYHNATPNARAVQEQMEEKVIGRVPEAFLPEVVQLPDNTHRIRDEIRTLSEKADIPFLATDRSVMNLPGVGKSMTFRVIGITRHGRRILEFDHDHTRWHSPIIHEMGKVVIIESKSIAAYLQQMQELGEDVSEYQTLYGYSIGETEDRMPIYKYPAYAYSQTKSMSNLSI